MIDNPVSMDRSGITPLDRAGETAPPAKGPGKPEGASFQEVLLDSIRDVDRLQTDAESATGKAVAPGEESVAEVMTAVERADIAFRTLMHVRNELVEAYEELMRMRL